MTYKYEIKSDVYNAINEKFISKIELGDSKIFEDNERIKDIIKESNATVINQEWISKYNSCLSFNNEYQRNYFFY